MMNRNKKLVFVLLLLLLLVDRIFTLIHFGFEYTDIDQILQWEGALDYANGIFREPFFYGQNYNYMVESFLAVPLVWMNVPVYMALPITTSWLILFPFVILALFFFRRNAFFWSYFCLALPVVLPLEFNMLTTMSRGFVQASLFIPLLFFALFNPEKGRSVTLFYLGTALSFMANPSSVIFSFPVGVYLFAHHHKSVSFYLKSLIILPFLFLLWLSKEYYVVHPEKLLLHIEGIDLELKTLVDMLTKPYLFEYLFPVFPKLGWIYPYLFILLLIWFVRKWGSKMETFFIAACVLVVLLSLSVPKVLFGEESSLVFYTHSRLFIQLPLLLILVLYFVFRSKEKKTMGTRTFAIWSSILFFGTLSLFAAKNYNFKTKSTHIAEETTFPVITIGELTTGVNYIDSIANKFDAQVMITQATMGWQFAFKSFAYRTIMETKLGHPPKMIAVHNVGDRRTWLYEEVESSERILLYVCFIKEENLKGLDHQSAGHGLHLIKNNTLPLSKLFKKLELDYGNKVREFD